MRIGGFSIDPVFDGRALEPRGLLVAREGEPEAEWTCVHQPEDANGRLALDLGGHLVRGNDRVVLVDAGVGTATAEHRTGGQLLESLAALGVEPDDVTDVVFTHLHFDHVGWATQKGEVVFPRATYRAHVADWEHFVSNPDAAPGAVKKLSPLEAQLELLDAETEIFPGFVARPAPGHTPGSTIFLISDGAERALLLGDVVHTVVEMTEPHWQGLIDLDPSAAKDVRARIVDEATAAGDVVAAAHFPGLRFGRLVTTARGGRSFSYL